MAPVEDVSFGITPELITECGSNLLFVKMNNKNRLAGSIFSEISQEYFTDTPDVDNVTELKDLFNTIQSLVRDQKVLALHDISDGGLASALAEMCFTKKVGMDISLPDINLNDINANLFSEEVGLVLQVEEEESSKIESLLKSKFTVANLGAINNSKTLNISCQSGSVFSEPVEKLESKWREVSHAIQSMRDNSITADEEQNLLFDKNHKGLFSDTSFTEIQINTLLTKPKVAVLREQGVNGQMEMAAAYTLAGFEAVDVHMQDLLDGNIDLSLFNGLAACGGFSYGDVLGAGGGWSKTILNNLLVKDQFERFFLDQSTFTLGVCNGCQMVSNLKEIIPGAASWPAFTKNVSDQFEARLAQVKVEESNSILLSGMAGWSLPIASAHGEGHALFSADSHINHLENSNQIALRFVDSAGNPTESYPLNPNGSKFGITGVTSSDGRVTIMMPHPERVFRSQQMSWRSKDWKEFSPWMQIFYNALDFSKNS
jgi:phosphoribosylformylglycinamidine synthase